MANYNVTVECTYTFDVEIMGTSTKKEQRILFSECANKTTDIFTKKFCDTVAEKLNDIL